MKQSTLKKQVSCSDVGLHSGNKINMTLLPSPANTGITFQRTDVAEKISFIKATHYNVSDTKLCTVISNEYGVKVATIEHLMSALWANSIDNLVIQLDGSELPCMGGCAENFVSLIKEAGIRKLSVPSNIIAVTKKVEVTHNDSKIIMLPNNELIIDMTIDFNNKVIGKQNFVFSEKNNFQKDVSRARTFGLFEEIKFLQENNYGKGGSLDNTIVVKDDHILNENGLRYHNEFAVHKALDCLGDLYLCGGFLKAKIIAYKSSHFLNNLALKKLFNDKSYIKIPDGRKNDTNDNYEHLALAKAF